MTLREIAVAGLWAASAVKVTQFTYAAYTATYSEFPGTGTGSGSVQQSVNKNETPLGVPKNVTGLADSILHPFDLPKGAGTGTFGLHGPITKWLQNLLGVNAEQRSAPPAGKKAPPTPLVTAIRRAAQHPTNKNGPQAWTAFTKWAYKNGWTHRDVMTYMHNIGITVK